VPLAERLRPRALDEVIGQQHLLGPGKPLRVAFESGRLHSMILWGPPGVGKTTLARLMAGAVDAQFIVLSAVLAGVKDIREAVERPRRARRAAAPPSSSSTRCTASTRRSRTPSCRTWSRAVHLHRRHHREPVVRGQFGAAVARHGACAEALDRSRPAQLLQRAQAMLGAPPLADARAQRLMATPTATRGGCSTPTRTWRWLAGRGGHRRSTSWLLERRWANAAPLRQGRRPVLRRHLGAAQERARLRPRRRAVLAGAHARRRRRPALRGAAHLRMASEDIGLADPRALRLALDAAEVYERLGSPEGELALAAGRGLPGVAPKSTPSTPPGMPCARWCKKRRQPPGARCTCAMRRRG
jgi:putative ATPase